MKTAAERARGLGFIVLLVILCVVFLFPGALFRGESFFERDLQGLFRPMKSLVAPLTRASSGLPLWNPAFASGQPFAANPHFQLFHPLTALFFFLPFEWAFRLQVVLPVLAAPFSMFFLLRALGLRTESAGFGALAWGCGGYALSTTNLLTVLFGIAVLPAVLAFAVRLAAGGRRRDLAGLALTFALECLAGEPSTLLMTGLLLPVCLIHAEPPAGGALPFRRRALLVVTGLLLGTVIGAATLLPGLHHASKTVRAGGLPDAVADQWSFPPVRLAEFVAPRFLGHLDRPDERWYWGRSLYPDRGYPLSYSIYAGLLVAIFSGVAAVRGFRSRWMWIGAAALGVLLAVGARLPLWHLARSLVPGMRGIRYPEKFILLTVFSVTVLASLGFDAWLREQAGYRRPLSRSLATVGFLATGSGLALLVLDAAGGSRVWAECGIPAEIAASWADVAARDAVRIGAVAAIALAALTLLPRAVWLLLVLEAADVVLAGRALVRTKPVGMLSSPPPFLAPLVRSKPEGPLFHLAAWDSKLGTTTGIAKPPAPAQWGIPTTLDADFDLMELRWSHGATARFLEAARGDPSLLPPLLARRGVSAVLRFRPGLSGTVGERLGSPLEGPLQLLRPPNPLPFVFCASRLVPAAGEDGWRDAVKRLGPDAATAAVADPGDFESFPDEVSEGSVERLLATPGRVDFDVTASGPKPAFVAVNQTWDEGWSARVDAVSVPVVRTDLSLSGLLVPPGRHHVALLYEDPWVTAGLLASLAGLAALLVVPAVSLPGRRPPAAS